MWHANFLFKNIWKTTGDNMKNNKWNPFVMGCFLVVLCCFKIEDNWKQHEKQQKTTSGILLS